MSAILSAIGLSESVFFSLTFRLFFSTVSIDKQFQQLLLLSLILEDQYTLCEKKNFTFFKCGQGEESSSVFLPSAVSCLGVCSWLTHSPGPLFPPTPPSHSAPAVPQRGRQRSPGPEPPAGHTHTHSQHRPTALELWLSFPSPTQKQKHTLHTLPTHMQYPH